MMRNSDKGVEITGWMTGGVMEIISAEAICQATENSSKTITIIGQSVESFIKQ